MGVVKGDFTAGIKLVPVSGFSVTAEIGPLTTGDLLCPQLTNLAGSHYVITNLVAVEEK